MWLHTTKTLNHEHYKTWMALYCVSHSIGNHFLLHLEMAGQRSGSTPAHHYPIVYFIAGYFAHYLKVKAVNKKE